MALFKKDMTGQKYGRWTVIEYIDHGVWRCRCDCGTIGAVQRSGLRLGHSKSCGCFMSDEAVRRQTTHGMTKTSEYRIWSMMKVRCNKPEHRTYKYYGGRGIKVCDEWEHSFEAFLKAVGNRPSKKHTLDRIDNNGNYCPENCRWATRAQQDNNRRNNKVITWREETKTLSQWCIHLGIDHARVRRRMQEGMSFERAVLRPVGHWAHVTEPTSAQP
jgi:hypothetical protein